MQGNSVKLISSIESVWCFFKWNHCVLVIFVYDFSLMINLYFQKTIFIGLALIFFSQLAIQTIDYTSMETITKTYLDSIDTDQPIVTFVFTAKYATIYHELYQKQFNRELIKDGYILRPTNKVIKEILKIFDRQNQVLMSYHQGWLEREGIHKL